jgi:hypothetical protein
MIAKARSGEWSFSLAFAIGAAVMSAGLVCYAAWSGVPPPWGPKVVAAAVVVTCFWFAAREISKIWNDTEWELCVAGKRLLWIKRNRSHEEIEFEVDIREIHALTFVPGDGESAAYLEMEFDDGRVLPLPMVGVPSDEKVNSFIEYWHENLPHIPIRGHEDT